MLKSKKRVEDGVNEWDTRSQPYTAIDKEEEGEKELEEEHEGEGDKEEPQSLLQ